MSQLSSGIDAGSGADKELGVTLRLAGGVLSSDVADYDLLKEEALPTYGINMTQG